MAGRELPRREREDRVGSVERYDALHVARAGTLEEEVAEVFGPFRGFVSSVICHGWLLGPGLRGHGQPFTRA
jgi:hypothetical protein